jgi:DNA helicase IV
MSTTAHEPEAAAAASGQASETMREQPVVDVMYGTVDRLRVQAERSVTSAVGGEITGTPQSLAERDAIAAFHRRRLAELDGVEERLCFGRLDLAGGVRRYVGRIGLPSQDGGDEPLLVDWRAPVAAPFYQATPAARGDVVRRRHLTIEDRRVVAVEDEALDLDALDDSARSTLVGEGPHRSHGRHRRDDAG